MHIADKPNAHAHHNSAERRLHCAQVVVVDPYDRSMDPTLLWTAIGGVAGVAGLGVAAWQLVIAHRDGRLRRSATAVSSTAAVGRIVLAPLGQLPNSGVRGRAGLVNELVGRRTKQGKVIVLAGMGGVGKSTVALACCELAKRRQHLVWWMPGTDLSSLIAGMVGIAQRLGASNADLSLIGEGTEAGVDRVWSLLERVRQRWLLVLDNVDDLDILMVGGTHATAWSPVVDGRGWLRQSSRGTVLVTSRMGDPSMWGSLAQVRTVDPLDGPDAELVLLDLAPMGGNSTDARRLANALGRLPLALHLAGTVVGSPFSHLPSFGQYERALADAGPDLLDEISLTSPLADQRSVVTRTWQLSLAALDARLPHAGLLLQFLSFYAPAVPIPTILVSAEAAAGPLGVPDASRTGVGMHRANHVLGATIRGLLAYSLVAIEPTDAATRHAGGLVMHPLISATSRRQVYVEVADMSADSRVDGPRALPAQSASRRLVSETLSRNVEDPTDWQTFRILAPHLVAVASTAMTLLSDEDVQRLVSAAAAMVNAFNWSGSPLAGVEVAEAVFRSPPVPSLMESEECLQLRAHYWLANGMAGLWADAEKGLRDVLAIRVRRDGQESTGALNVRHEMAVALGRLGRWREAQSEFDGLVAARARLCGPLDQLTLSARRNRAWSVGQQGRWDEALAELTEVLWVRTDRFGQEDRYTLSARHSAAWAMANLGRWEEAEPELKQVLEIRARLFGPDHPDTLKTRYDIARAARHLGRRSAKRELRQILAIQVDRLGDQHPETVATRVELANLGRERVV
jgi:tetratricopeptide (TPR) repeat protein